MVDVRKGGIYNAWEVHQIISEDKWPMLECKTCGASHLAAIRKNRDSRQGGEFEFVEAECANRPTETHD
jgi:hypothetical protein